ncbi:MAG: AbiH family protein, partial [Erysipelotrichaceae bacterium]
MKLVVLGNGFDLACGLPTSYPEFFKWRYSHIEQSKLDEIDNLYTNFNHYKYNIGNSYSTPAINMKIEEQIKNTVKVFLDHDMSFWDVYFYLLKLEKSPITNWCDVELQIENAITDENGRALIDKVFDYGISKIKKAIELRLQSISSGVTVFNLSNHSSYYE